MQRDKTMTHLDRRVLRVPDTEAATGYKRASLYRLEAEGRFPRRVKLGQGQGGAVGWRAEEVRAWLDARAAGQEWTPTTPGEAA
jgi:prophage regulatory protein